MPAIVVFFAGWNDIRNYLCARDEYRCQYVGEVVDATWGGNAFVDEGHLSRQRDEKLATILAGRITRLQTEATVATAPSRPRETSLAETPSAQASLP